MCSRCSRAEDWRGLPAPGSSLTDPAASASERGKIEADAIVGMDEHLEQLGTHSFLLIRRRWIWTDGALAKVSWLEGCGCSLPVGGGTLFDTETKMNG